MDHRVPQPALLEAINAAGAAGASRCRVLCSCPWGLRAAPSSSPLWDPERPRCLQSRPRAGSAGGRGPEPARNPHRPRASPPVPLPRPGPGSAPAEVHGYRKSLPKEVPPQPLPVRARSGRGFTGVSWGENRTGILRPEQGQSGAGGDPGQGQPPPGPFVGRGVPAVFPWGSAGRTVSPGEGREAPAPLCTRGSLPCPGAGDGRDWLFRAAEPLGPSRPVPQQRGHGEPPALRGPHGDGAERKRGGGVRRPEQVRIDGNRGARAPQPGRAGFGPEGPQFLHVLGSTPEFLEQKVTGG